jgi:ATP-dependent RNA helicase DBP3
MGIPRTSEAGKREVSEVQIEKKVKGEKRKRAEAAELCQESTATESLPSSKKVKKEKPKTNDSADWYKENKVEVGGVEEIPAPALTFKEAGITKRLVKHCESQFTAPTPIQAATWPLILSGLDVKGIAKTGSGKTLAFAMPFLAMSERGELDSFEQPTHYARMVVMAPTRELTMQIHKVCAEFSAVCKGSYPVVTLVGGVPKGEQLQQIRTNGADIVCATPGRLADLSTAGHVDLSSVKFFVLDEADRMLDLGFVDEVKRIAAQMPTERQTVLYSATWPAGVDKLARSLLRKGQICQVMIGKGEHEEEGCALKANEKIDQQVIMIDDPRSKFRTLTKILNEHKGKKAIVFALYKKEAARLEEQLQGQGFPKATALQGDMAQEKRTRTIAGFRDGSIPIMIATDVASRGLDVPDIDLVVNYTFPLTVEDYVHRIGRTARAGKKGKAITLFNHGKVEGVQDERQHAADLKRILEEANQPVPEMLAKISGSTAGNKATKKKAHPIYGNHFKDDAEIAKLEAKKVHVSFDDSDDE